MRIILASKSPRRKELLSQLFSKFEIFAAECDESLGGLCAVEGVLELAKRKGKAALDLINKDKTYLSSIGAESCSELLIISSDTLVECDGVPLGKPSDAEDARKTLRMLSGRWHNVHTGVAIHYRGKCFADTRTTEVRFKELSDVEIEKYIATGEPFDKAGAYGIQGEAGKFVSELRGDVDTVIGLSLSLTRELYEKITQAQGVT